MGGAARRQILAGGLGRVDGGDEFADTPLGHREDEKVGNRKNIVILSFVIALYWFSQYMYMPFLTPHLLKLGLTASAAGIIAGAYGLTQLCFRFPIGVMADRSQRYLWIIRGGILLSLCSSLGFYAFQRPALLFASNFAQGLSSSTWLSFVILYSRLFKESDYQKAMGLSNGLNQGGIVGSYLMGGVLMDRIGIHPLFLISACVASGVFILTFFLEVPQDGNNAGAGEGRAINWKEVFGKEPLLYSFSGLVAMFVAFGTAFSFTATAAENLGASGLQLAGISIAFTLSAVLGSFMVSNVFIQGLRPGIVIGSCLLVISGCCVGIGCTGTLGGIIAAQVLEGGCIYLLFSYAMGNATKRVGQGSKSTAMGVFQTIYSAGIFLGPVFVGQIAQVWGLRAAFKAIAVVPVIGAGVIFLYFKLNKEENGHEDYRSTGMLGN